MTEVSPLERAVVMLNQQELARLLSLYIEEKDGEEILRTYGTVVETEWENDPQYRSLAGGISYSYRLAASILFLHQLERRRGFHLRRPKSASPSFKEDFFKSLSGVLSSAYKHVRTKPSPELRLEDYLLISLFEGTGAFFNLYQQTQNLRTMVGKAERNLEAVSRRYEEEISGVRHGLTDATESLRVSEARIEQLEEGRVALMAQIEKMREEDETVNAYLGDKFDRRGYVDTIIRQYAQIEELNSQIDILEQELREARGEYYDLSGYMGKRIYVLGVRSKATQEKLEQKLKAEKILFLGGTVEDLHKINGSVNEYEIIVYIIPGIKYHKIQERLYSNLQDKNRVVLVPRSINYSAILRVLAEYNANFLSENLG